ncbi:thiol-disulfide oxidoreductase DCC family protein [Paenibacillus marinisediminis]
MTKDTTSARRIDLEVWYDSWCPMCSGIKARLEKLDWLHALHFRSIRDHNALMQSPLKDVSPTLLEQRMYIRNMSTGTIRSGIEAIESISSVVPLLWPLWPTIVVSRMFGLGQRLYDYIASRRLIVPTGACAEGSCEWKPPSSDS